MRQPHGITITARCALCEQPLRWPLSDYRNASGAVVHRSCVERIRLAGLRSTTASHARRRTQSA